MERTLVRVAERITLARALLLVSGAALALVLAAAAIERLVEPATFTSYGRAVWWAVVTVGTVGYGDVIPTSPAGRSVAALLILFSLALVPILTRSSSRRRSAAASASSSRSPGARSTRPGAAGRAARPARADRAWRIAHDERPSWMSVGDGGRGRRRSESLAAAAAAAVVVAVAVAVTALVVVAAAPAVAVVACSRCSRAPARQTSRPGWGTTRLRRSASMAEKRARV
ncbi:MAG: potassium channel family protein [Thermoleophilia bacterium]